MLRTKKIKIKYQELGGGLEIVETVLSVVQSSGVVPGFAVFTSTANVGDDHVTEVLREKQMSDRKAGIKNFTLVLPVPIESYTLITTLCVKTRYAIWPFYF